MLQKQKQKLAQMQAQQLRTVCERVTFYSEFHVDSEFQVETVAVDEFNRAFNKSAQGSRCFGLCGVLEQRLDNEMLRSEQFTLKVLQICLCLFSLLLCPFISGTYGERGICFALSMAALLLIIGLLTTKLVTLNRWLTPQHWFVMEASIYTALCLLFSLSSLAMALLSAHRHLILQQEQPADQLLAYIEALVLALCAGTFAMDVGCVYSQRLARTWIPAVSKYRI